jgi:hypothetical protein
MRRAFVISLLLAVVGGYGFAQTGGAASSRGQNLRDWFARQPGAIAITAYKSTSDSRSYAARKRENR